MNVSADAVQLAAGSVVRVASTVTARESKERHCCHAGGAKNHAEYVEVHLFSSPESEVLFSDALMQESPDERLVRGFCIGCFSAAIEEHVGCQN